MLIAIKILSAMSGLFTFFAYFYYFKQISRNDSTPNPTTHLVWFIVFIINTMTYFILAEKSLWLSLNGILSTIGYAVLLIYTYQKNKFSPFKKIELVTLIIALGVLVYWVISKNAQHSNLLLQLVLLIASYPTILGIIRGEVKEYYLSWTFGSLSYLSLTLAILLKIDSLGLVALVFPMLSLLRVGSIGTLAYYKSFKFNKQTI